jgi:hypothetical protein
LMELPFVGGESEEITEEEREELEAEKKLEKVKKNRRNVLIKRLSSGNFRAAEQKGDEWIPSREDYIRLAGAVAELLISRKLAKAENYLKVAISQGRVILKNEGSGQAQRIAHGKMKSSLEEMRGELGEAPAEIERGEEIMEHYSEELQEIDRENGETLFAYLEELLEEKKGRIEQLRERFNELVNAKNEATEGNLEPLEEAVS